MKPPRVNLPKMTDRLALGDTDLRVSPFCLGMVSSEDTPGAAFDAGINFFFISADLHWPYYESTRRGLAKLLARSPNIRKQIVVAITSYVTQPVFCAGALEEGVEAVPGLKYIDVGVIGGAYGNEFSTRLQVYQEFRNKGRFGIKTVGATFHDRAVALQAANQNLVDIALIRYNPLHPGAKTDLFPHLIKSSSTLLYNFKSTMGYVHPERYVELKLKDDYWQPEITDYYRFALTCPEIDGLLCSPTKPGEVTALSKALAAGPLTEEEEKYLIDLATLDQGDAVLMQD